MKRMPAGGYTIIEVMIFLVVSTALLVSALALISGRQERIRFSQAVVDFDQQLQDTLNDVSTGYYPTQESFSCSYDETGDEDNTITFDAEATESGTNKGCVFLGKAIQFGPGTQYRIYTMAGGEDVESIGKTEEKITSLADAGVKLLGVAPTPGIAETMEINADVEITKVVSLAGTGDVSGLAMVSEFSEKSELDQSVSGNAAHVTLYEVRGNFVENAGKETGMNSLTSGLLLCLQQAGGGSKAALTIAEGGQRLTTYTQVDSWPEEHCEA